MANKRIRVEIDEELYESLRYFAQLRGLSTSSHMYKVLARFQAGAEEEFPPIRAHMLAWRQAKEAQRVAATDLDDIPF